MEQGSHGKSLIGSALNFDQDNSRLKLARMIVMHELPFSLADFIGFREYSSFLQPIFKMPSRNTVRADIIKLYEYEKARMMKMFQNNNSRVAVTIDMWTSNRKKGFMAITTHYIDDSWNLQSRIIRFAYVMSPHTADVLCGVLIKSLMDWNLDNKLSTLTLDNCSTNDALINLVLKRFSSKKKRLLLSGKLLHMRCCAC
ncbi:Zinc finger BED domain-containing protein RICESLEEPER 2 [Euphorbia peplus]|nr:Zinc finger BED domain-containing protein RICESLEEPER 2 [Euphorbia peplus]